MSSYSTRRILSSLLEEENFEMDSEDLKNIYQPAQRSFKLDFQFGPGGHNYSRIITLLTDILPPKGDENLEKTESLVIEYAKRQWTEEAHSDSHEFVPRDDWPWMVNVEEIDPPVQLEAQEDEELDDMKEVMGLEGHPTKKGYFAHFSKPVVFSIAGVETPTTKVGPYSNTHQAHRKLRFGLMGNEGVTGEVKQERYVPYYPVYDNFVDMDVEFLTPEEALECAEANRKGVGVYGVANLNKDVVMARE